MRCLLVALCVASLAFSSAYGARNGVVAKEGGKAVKALVAVALGAIVVCSGLTGCDQSMQMTENVIAVTRTTPNPFKIGVIYEQEFSQSWDGAELAAMQANLNGGVNGRYIELIPQRIYARSKPETVRAAENLVHYDEVMVLVGANYSTLSEYIDETSATEEVSMVAMASTSAGITRASEYVFLSSPPNSFQGWVMAKHAIDDLDANSVAVLFWSQDAYSRDLAESFRDSFSGMGGTVVTYEGYSYDKTMDNEAFAAQLNDSDLISAVIAAQPDAVYLPSFGESGIVAGQLRKAGSDAQLLGGDGWDVDNLIENGGAAIEGARYTGLFTPDAVPELNKLYFDTYGTDMDSLSSSGFDATMIVIQAARRAGDDLTRATLRDEIEATENYMGATNLLRYDKDRHPIKSMNLFEIKKGKVAFVKTVDP